MRKIKKLLSVCLCIILLLSAIPLSTLTVSAETYNGTCGENLTWEFNDTTGTLTISGTGDMTEWNSAYSVPWNEYRFDTITVIISEGVTNISYFAFQDCKNLTSVIIPTSVTSIEEVAFMNCTELTKITIPNGVKNIGDSAFFNCKSLNSVTLPNTLTDIKPFAFSDCISLNEIKIPKSVMNIGESAFANCVGLETILVDSLNPYYHSNNNCLIETSNKTLVVGCKNSIIPNDNSVTSIGNTAFYGRTDLTAINIPNGIISIGNEAFYNCSSLTNIEIPSSVISIGSYAFSKCSALTSVIISEGVKKIYSYAFSECNSLYKITIPKTVLTIEGGVFSDCKSLISVEILDGLRNISTSMFKNCENLTSIAIPESVKEIDSYAFLNCGRLSSIVIPDSITKIGDYAFAGCNSLTSFDIPNKVTYISSHVFSGCSRLISVTIPDGVQTISQYAFIDCIMLDTVVIPDSVEVIYNKAFANCSMLTYVTLPDNVEIYYGAFDGCDCLTLLVTENSSSHKYAIEEYIPFEFISKECLHNNTETRNIVPETCVTDGFSGNIYCLDCNTLLKSGELISATNIHNHTVLTEIPATCSQNGYVISCCSVCDDVITETVAATGHISVFSYQSATTYTEPAKNVYKCEICGEEEYKYFGFALCDFNKDGIIDKTDYTEFENNIAKLDTVVFDFDNNGDIGEFDSIIIKHLTNNTPFTEIIDVNGDGESNILDLIRTKKILLETTENIADTEEETENNPADCNLDGNVNSSDIMFVKKYMLVIDRSLYVKS